jgi:CRP-like cAMP-binding protein
MKTLSPVCRYAPLRYLPRKHLSELLKYASTREFQAGQMIFSKHETADYIFVVESGRVKIYVESASRKRKTFAYLGPGDIFGEMAVLLDAPRTASAKASEPSRVLILHKDDFRRFLLSNAEATLHLLHTVAARLRRTDEEVCNLLFRNVLGRVSKTLFDLASAYGRAQGRGLVLSRHYTHQDLADLVGTTREPLCRALASLKRAGIIEPTDRGIFIPDPRKLEALIAGSLGGS